jgi:hypothetical protein
MTTPDPLHDLADARMWRRWDDEHHTWVAPAAPAGYCSPAAWAMSGRCRNSVDTWCARMDLDRIERLQ